MDGRGGGGGVDRGGDIAPGEDNTTPVNPLLGEYSVNSERMKKS